MTVSIEATTARSWRNYSQNQRHEHIRAQKSPRLRCLTNETALDPSRGI